MDKLFFGLEVAVLGMGVVFASLIFLSFLTQIMGNMLSEKKTAGGGSTGIKPADVIESKTQESHVEQGLSPKVTAAIAAAIAVMASSTGTQLAISNIRVVDRKSRSKSWAAAGRQEQMLARQ